MADRIKRDSLEWSLTHIKRFGDTDVFPVPFEYEAISHGKDGLFDELSKIDLATYEPRPLNRFLVPKTRGGYRVAIQLDPIDTLLLTSITYEAAELIEEFRIPPERRVACSYRIDIGTNGQFFRTKNGWPDFHQQSSEYTDSGSYDFVLLADIADFYNQISHHRVRNAFEMAGVSPIRSKNVENLLMNLTARQSRGIPVGPSASIIFSEACLSDVDDFLLRKGYVHTRYSDDFRIFCKTRSEAFMALHDLSEYLYTSHRLALQSGKINVLPINEFVENVLLDPESLEEQRKTLLLNAVMAVFQEQIDAIYPDFLGEERIEKLVSSLPKEEMRVVRQNLGELFNLCLDQSPLHLFQARYLLRRATAIDSGVLRQRTLANLEILAPVIREVARYLIKTTNARSSADVSDALHLFIEQSDFAFVPYLRLWILEVFLKRLLRFDNQQMPSLFSDFSGQLGVRPMALAARALNMPDWVRERKEIWNNHGPWDRRAIIWAGSVLSADEKRYWLRRIQSSGDILDRVVAGTVLGT